MGGVKSGGNGINIDSSGLISTKLGTGLAYDTSYNIVPDTANIDVTQLKNFSSLTTGAPQGFFDSSATLATFANPQKGSFWIYNGTGSFSLGGRTFSTGDELWCTTTATGTPANLTTGFAYVADTLAQATTSSYGSVKLGNITPLMDSSTAAIGTSTGMAREDHVHPSDSNKISKITSSTDKDIAIFSGTTGGVLADSGKTLPNGTIVGTSDTQSLTNKTLSDTTTTIMNATDNTKLVKFDVSGVSTSATRTLAVQDKSGTIALSPTVSAITANGNITLNTNYFYDVSSTTPAGSVLTLPSGAKTGDTIEFIVSCNDYNDSTNLIISGTINGASNTVIVNRSYIYFKFIWSVNNSTWILSIGQQGF